MTEPHPTPQPPATPIAIIVLPPVTGPGLSDEELALIIAVIAADE